MPPSAAPEWLRVGWSFEITATSAPASCASIAARMPAQPAPTTRTSCFAITCGDATESGAPAARLDLPGAAAQHGHLGAVRRDAGDVDLVAPDHEVDVDGALVDVRL